MSGHTVEEYLAMPYRMEVYWDEDHWAAEFPELPGLVAGHETWAGLAATIEGAKRSANNQLTNWNGSSLSYDLNGNLTGESISSRMLAVAPTTWLPPGRRPKNRTGVG